VGYTGSEPFIYYIDILWRVCTSIFLGSAASIYIYIQTSSGSVFRP
jgi:hypothetical protein